MTRVRLELRRSDLVVDPPLVNAGATWDRRTTATLLLHEADGGENAEPRCSGCGEASPLPGYSPDTHADVERALAALDEQRLAALAALRSPRELLDALPSALPDAPPALRFGLETALLDRLGRASSLPLWRLLAEAAGTGPAPREVALCGLVPSGEPGAAVCRVERMLSAGVRTFKLKIGPLRLSSEQEATLEALRDRWGMDIALRLDCNCSLARAELAVTLARLARFLPELVEEPLAAAAPEELAGGPCPLALDESLQALGDAERERWIERSGARAVVLKPTTLGGLNRCLRLAAAARRHGCDSVVSHALEGPLGWAACAHLALALDTPRAAGLWPLSHQRTEQPRVLDGRLLPPVEPGVGGWA